MHGCFGVRSICFFSPYGKALRCARGTAREESKKQLSIGAEKCSGTCFLGDMACGACSENTNEAHKQMMDVPPANPNRCHTYAAQTLIIVFPFWRNWKTSLATSHVYSSSTCHTFTCTPYSVPYSSQMSVENIDYSKRM